MAEGLGFGKRKLIEQIVKQNFGIETLDQKKFYSYEEMLFVIQEMLELEGRTYFESHHSIMQGFQVFRQFVELLLYRNMANYDSMILVTSEKGCITGDACLEMPRDLKKYPKGIPLHELEGKGPIYVYSFNIKTKKLELKKCDGVEFVKEDDVWEIELHNGMKIQTTKDHPFLQVNGEYKQLKDLIYSNKKGYYYQHKTDRIQLFSRPFLFDGNDNRIKIDFSNINRQLGDTSLKHSEIEHRFIFSQLGFNINNKVVHHKNHCNYDNNISNLELLDNQSAHYNIHNMSEYKFKEKNNYQQLKVNFCTKKKNNFRGSKNFILNAKNKREQFCENNKEYISNISKERETNNINSNHIRCGGIIKSITYIGKKKVYDVVNVCDNHNFIVNGFIVSNTGKSSAAIMLARQWCKLLGIKFSPARHIAYNNADLMRKIDALNKFEVIICDEAVRFVSSEDWAKKENKTLKKKLAQVRTKHLLYILCFPLKVYKVEKTYLENYVNYWLDLYSRGRGIIYIKNKNPSSDSWSIKEFANVGNFNEFTNHQKVLEKLKKHPNFWQSIKFPKVPDWLYEQYLKVREKNVYDDDAVLSSVGKEDICNAALILALRDIMLNDQTLTMNRILLHIKNELDIQLSKGQLQAAIEDAKQLVMKVREKAISMD